MAKSTSKPKRKAVRAGQHWYRMEEPSFEPSQDAAFYITCAGGAQGPLGPKAVGKPEIMSRRRDPWRYDSPLLVKQEMPEGLSEWRYEIATVSQDVFAPYHADVYIREDRIEWLPDIFRGWQWTVSSRFKDVVTELDPEGHYFFPVKLFSLETKEVLRDDYFSWYPRRRFTYLPKTPHSLDKTVYADLMNPALSGDAHWELIHNLETRAFFKKIPIWGYNVDPDYVVYNLPAFSRLKAGGFTGLVEHKDGDPMLENPMATIGCIY